MQELSKFSLEEKDDQANECSARSSSVVRNTSIAADKPVIGYVL